MDLINQWFVKENTCWESCKSNGRENIIWESCEVGVDNDLVGFDCD